MTAQQFPHSMTAARPQWQAKAAILREMLADPDRLILCPGVYDGFTARIALSQGFDCLYMTGAGTSVSRVGQPDLGMVTMVEMQANAAMITSLDLTTPLIADADAGYGGPLSVARTVRAYIDANVAALHLEDQVISKRCGHLPGKELVSQDDFIVRIRAAAMARQESGRDIVLIARTDALETLGFENAIARLRAAINAGADAVFLEGIHTREQGQQACQLLSPTPCLINMVPGGVTPIITADEAKQLGFRIMIWPLVALTEVYNSTLKAMIRLKERGIVEEYPSAAGGIRDVFGVCELGRCRAFDAAANGFAGNLGQI